MIVPGFYFFFRKFNSVDVIANYNEFDLMNNPLLL